MKVFITGATGFVGGRLTKELVEQGHQVTALVRNPAQCLELKNLGVDLKAGDVTQLNSFENLISSEITVFHLAGVVGYSRAQRQLMNQVNIEGTRNVVSAVKKMKAQRLVYMSSVVAIGASRDGSYPLDESSKYDIKNLNLGYFETKRIAEEIVLSAAHANDIDAVALNPSTIYGAGDAKKGSRKTQLKVARGEFLFYTSGGVSIIAIEDVITATLKAWDVGRSGERYILAGDNITIHELFNMIAACAGVEPPKIYLPNFIVHSLGKIGDCLESIGKKGPINSENAWTSTLFHWFSHEKAKKELGLNPKPARFAIENSIRWVKEQGWLQ